MLLQVPADRQQATQLLHLGKRQLQLLDARRESLLQLQHARAHAHARQQLSGMTWLHEIVVCASLEAGDDILASIAARQQDQ